MRRKIIAGNWKLNKTCAEAVELIEDLKPRLADRPDVETVVCPVYTALYVAHQALAGSGIGLGAQNLFWKESGAYTGQVAPSMLTDVGVQYVILGHSEARGRFGVAEPDLDDTLLRYFGETDASV